MEEEKRPAENNSAEESTAAEVPAEEKQAAETPAAEPNAADIPVETAAEETPASETPAEVTPAAEASAEATPAAEIPAEATPASETPAEVTPAAEIPAEATPAAETPAEAAPATETPAEATPAAEASAEAAPAAETPAEAAPAAEASAENADASDDEEYTPKDFANDALDLVGSVLASVFVVILLFAYVFCIADVEGESMLPTLEPNDRLFVLRVGTTFETGDILIIDSDKAYTFDAQNNLVAGRGLEKRIVKRLIAQGGQEVRIDFSEGAVYVDGKALQEPYISSLTKRDEGAFRYPIIVPEGYVFVLGDNRYVSRDSRHPTVGLIPEKDIIGEVVYRIAPFSAFGKVE